MKEFLENIDMNGVRFNFTYDSKNRFRTQFGGGLTFIYILIVTALIISNYLSIKNKYSLNISSYTTPILTNSLINYSNFKFGIGFKSNSEVITTTDYFTIQAKQTIPNENSIEEISFQSCKDEKNEGFICFNLLNTISGRQLTNINDNFVSIEYSFDYGKYLKDSNFIENPIEVFLYLPIVNVERHNISPILNNSFTYKIQDFRKYNVYINLYSIQDGINAIDSFSVSEIKEIKGFRKGIINLHLNNLKTVYNISSYNLQEAFYHVVSWSAIFYLIINSIGKIYNSNRLKEQFINETFVIVDNKEHDNPEALKIELGEKRTEDNNESNDEDTFYSDKNNKIDSFESDKKIEEKFSSKRNMKKFVDFTLKFRIILEYFCCKKARNISYQNNNLNNRIKEAAYNSYTDAKHIIKKLEHVEYLKNMNFNHYQNHLLNRSKINMNLSYADFDHFNVDENYIKEFFKHNITDENIKTEKSRHYLKERIEQNNLSEFDKFLIKKINF